jgi:predicted O-linked N-acetylglucosamine transferase (SPINDLY family)
VFAGLPVVALVGRCFAGRVAASVLRAARLDAQVADSLARYEALILGLGRDRAALARLRAAVAVKRAAAPLFDLTRFVRALEDGYASVWYHWRDGMLS